MKNLILALTRDSIPYVRQLNVLTGGMIGSVLMQQLDFYFRTKPDGFYKFLNPASGNPAYRAGDSWSEDLGISEAEFRTAFDKIGVRYADFSKFKAAGANAFQGKFYASYVDKRTNLTYYVRNHEFTDQKLFEVFAPSKATEMQAAAPMPHAQLQRKEVKLESPLPVKTEEVGQPSPVVTSVATGEATLADETVQATEEELDALVYPALPEDELLGIRAEISMCPQKWRQAVLDEVEGKRLNGGFKKTAASFLHTLVRSAQEDSFRPNLAIRVQRDRQKSLKNEVTVPKNTQSPTQKTLATLSADELARLPPNMRQRAMQAQQERLALAAE